MLDAFPRQLLRFIPRGLFRFLVHVKRKLVFRGPLFLPIARAFPRRGAVRGCPVFFASFLVNPRGNFRVRPRRLYKWCFDRTEERERRITSRQRERERNRRRTRTNVRGYVVVVTQIRGKKCRSKRGKIHIIAYLSRDRVVIILRLARERDAVR